MNRLRTTALVSLLGCAFWMTSTLAAMPPGQGAPNWAGTWRGELVNFPARPGAARVEVERELGPVPTVAGACSVFKTTYREGGVVKGIKDYRLCLGTDPDSLYVDEGDGVRLAARLIGGVLVSPFRVGNLLLVAQMRLVGDTLEEEILTVADQPAVPGVQSLTARNIQRLTFVRAGAR
jgi:hypothetical protein